MTALAHQQAIFLEALLAPRLTEAAAGLRPLLAVDAPTDWARGLMAYRSNGLELAHQVLAAAYPVTALHLEPENFVPLAQRLWREEPPARGDLGRWGAAFPGLLAQVRELVQDQPALPDLAALEWSLHQAATAPDVDADLASLVRLTDTEPDRVGLRLASGLAWRSSPFPIASLLLAADGPCAAEGPETALVWRQGLRPRVRPAGPGEPEFLQAALDGACLLEALAHAPDFDFAAWLEPAVRDGLLAGITTRP